MSKRHGHHEDDGDTLTITKVAIWQIVAAVFAVLFIASLFTGGFGFKGTTTGTSGTGPVVNQPPTTGGAPPAGNVQISMEGAHILGNPDADVVMYEFSSYTCPFCKRFHDETFSDIKKNYIDTGKILYVYKHFTRNQVDVVAANAAECAGEQGKFFEYSNKIYANQAALSDQEAFSRFASELGLNTQEFDTCFESQKYSQKASQNLQEGQANGVTGTPGFIIGGKLIPGAQPYNVFASAIDAALV